MNTFQDGLKAWMDLYRYRACPGSYLKYAFSINKAKYYNQIGESSWQSLHYLIFIINSVVILQCTAFQWWHHSNREFSNYAQFHRGRMSSPAQVIIIQHNTRMGLERHQCTSYHCPACRTSLIATRFWVVVICPIIKCLTVLEFSFFCLICVYSSQFYFELCTYCNILDIYLS